MNSLDIIRFISNRRNLSLRKMSTNIGKKPTFLSRYANANVNMGTSLLITLANAHGFDIILRDRETGSEWTLEN